MDLSHNPKRRRETHLYQGFSGGLRLVARSVIDRLWQMSRSSYEYI